MTAVLIVFIVIGIPVLGGLALGAYKEWLKHRGRFATTAEIEELKTQIARLQAENQNLRQRIENLETIVVSEVWEERTRSRLASPPNLELPPTLE
jgi:Tfp pilus assembly major pilin PilA